VVGTKGGELVLEKMERAGQIGSRSGIANRPAQAGVTVAL
jgi:hypothetical protein